MWFKLTTNSNMHGGDYRNNTWRASYPLPGIYSSLSNTSSYSSQFPHGCCWPLHIICLFSIFCVCEDSHGMGNQIRQVITIHSKQLNWTSNKLLHHAIFFFRWGIWTESLTENPHHHSMLRSWSIKACKFSNTTSPSGYHRMPLNPNFKCQT